MKTLDLINMKHSFDGMKIPLPYASTNIGQNFTLFVAGDEHIGNAGVDIDKMDELVHAVRSKKNAFVVNMGDNLESISVKDPRYSILVHGCRASMIQEQRDAFISQFDAIGDRFLNIMDGNHEMKFKNDFKPNADIAKAFNSQYVDGTMCKLIFPEFRMLAWHGDGSIGGKAGDRLQRKTAEKVALKRKLRDLAADCEIKAMGHAHKLVLSEPSKEDLILMTDPEKLDLVAHYSQPGRINTGKGMYRIPEDDVYYMCTGSFLKGYIEGVSTYVEEKGYSPTELGWVEIDIKNGRPYDIRLVKSL
jgi:hypothetical protein